MSKRKDPSGQVPSKEKRKAKEDDESSDEDMDMLDVEFEFFDPQPDVDFHGLKTLLRQLLDVDHELFDLSALSDLILSQPTLGSTIKCDGNESDPYAFLTVLNLHEHRDKSVIRQLIDYLAKKSSASSSFSNLGNLLTLPSESQAQVGLILTERFVNMPSEVVPAMYKMLLEEIQWAINDKEPYQFTHYLIISKVYTEVESKLDQEEGRPSKKTRKDGSAPEVFLFHAEDDVLHKHALGHCTYGYDKQGAEGASDSKRAFQEAGIQPQGSMILLEASKFEETVKALEAYLNPGGA